MSNLDSFVIPEVKGTLHPYDVLALLENAKTSPEMVHSPKPEDEGDYQRNKHKIGFILSLEGERYFITTDAIPKYIPDRSVPRAESD